MAKTNYRACWWLIQVFSGDFGNGSFRDGTGYSMRNLNDHRPAGERIEWFTKQNELDDVSDEELLNKEKFRQTLMRWRSIIYNEFGLAILMESTPGVDLTKGNGGYYYYLANPEILENTGMTLREHIKFLAESEKDRDDWVSLTEMTNKFQGNLSIGFASTGGTSYRKILGEENLELIRFAILFGEVLTIKFGKVRNGIDINAPYSFEPYKVKEIEGRWYVIGNLYPLGHKEQSELAIYDLARLQFSDEENQDILYVPVNGFDINEHILLDAACKRRMGGVRPIDIITHTVEFADYLRSHPFCSAQEEIADGTFRIYINLTNELIVQLGAYGNEISIGMISKDGDEEHDRYVIRKALNFFRKSEE